MSSKCDSMLKIVLNSFESKILHNRGDREQIKHKMAPAREGHITCGEHIGIRILATTESNFDFQPMHRLTSRTRSCDKILTISNIDMPK